MTMSKIEITSSLQKWSNNKIMVMIKMLLIINIIQYLLHNYIYYILLQKQWSRSIEYYADP